MVAELAHSTSLVANDGWLVELGIEVSESVENGRGCVYRRALESALSGRGERVHYCDCECVVLERTTDAHRSLHVPLHYSEIPVNRIRSYLLHTDQYGDFLSGSFIALKDVVRTIVELSKEPDFGFYGEWPVIVFSKGYKMGFTRVRGLEWETPSRYSEEIEVEGYRRWLLSFETRDERKRIVRVAYGIMAGALNAARKLVQR